MSAGFDDREDPDFVAAEYVLGTLPLAERESFSERVKSDERARRAMVAWEARFAGLGDRVDDVAPPPEVWARVERQLGVAGGATMHPFKVIPGGGQGPDASIRRSRDRWRLGALLAGAIAAALVVTVAGEYWRGLLPEGGGTATYVAAVNRDGAKPALIVRVDLKTGKVFIRPIAAATPEGRSLELWYIGGDKTPRSMGLVDKAATTLNLPGTPVDDATFAVSVEPPGGSKTGGPTGPVVYAGQLVRE